MTKLICQGLSVFEITLSQDSNGRDSQTTEVSLYRCPRIRGSWLNSTLTRYVPPFFWDLRLQWSRLSNHRSFSYSRSSYLKLKDCRVSKLYFSFALANYFSKPCLRSWAFKSETCHFVKKPFFFDFSSSFLKWHQILKDFPFC